MRRSEIDAFLKRAGWQDAELTALAGDASRRRYFRAIRPGTDQRAVLMDAPPDSGEDVRPFLSIGHYLRAIGLSAPEILDADADQGLLLIEDLGDDLFARVAAARPDMERPLYELATDLLARLHREAPPANLATYTPNRMTEQAALILDWYLGPVSETMTETDRRAFTDTIHDLLRRHIREADVLIQRDYHSENLLWLPDRQGVKRVGLLDFQDATRGHRMYDLVSLLQDARRDVPPALEAAMRQHYAEASGTPLAEDDVAYAVLGAQRNLRILGVFARLALRDGKPHYLDLMPRVWGLLRRNLAHPALRELHQITTDLLPAPSEAIRSTLRQRCDTSPMLS